MKKILVVDDDRDVLEVVYYLLSSKGFDVKTHTTGLNVPAAVETFQPNLVLLDINLPGKSGTDICNELKEADNELPIILFSAHSNITKVRNACNPDGYLAKPFDIKDLIGIVRSHVN
jgi:DNA-binding response OmpR family regulator